MSSRAPGTGRVGCALRGLRLGTGMAGLPLVWQDGCSCTPPGVCSWVHAVRCLPVSPAPGEAWRCVSGGFPGRWHCALLSAWCWKEESPPILSLLPTSPDVSFPLSDLTVSSH